MSDPSDNVRALRSGLAELFQGLEAEAQNIVQQYVVELKGFFSGFGSCVDIARRAQADLDRIAATRFSVFPYFAARERDLSRIFGALLDPAGNHGQRERFLRPFLEELKIPAKALANGERRRCRVDLEFPTTTGETARYIDIVLHMQGEFWIGIENKPWAEDRPDQIRDYLREMQTRAEQDDTEAWMVYLSGDGTFPAEWPDLEPEERDRCRVVPYRSTTGERSSLERWVARCVETCEADRVRWFLRDLSAFVRREFKIAESGDADNEEMT